MIQGERITVEYTYPWLPPRCVSCGRWGHYETFCKEKRKEKEVEKMTTIIEGDQSKVVEGDNSVAEEGRKNTEQEIQMMEVNNTKKRSERDMEIKSTEEKEDEVVLEEGEISEWETVLGDKRVRSPTVTTLKYGQVSIATPSRFDALRNTDEKGEKMEVEQIEEVEEMRNEEA
ncbi:uncharacterized protein LOC117133997 [Brassica rapa]|uniref:uncharacterized protein LOC117133997 n=1 Tax=Brassica campestris TaxID=3711 RepID=UPI00142DDF52|nr:uncharacterized protein LOC117133997 [Brassica rapa]